MLWNILVVLFVISSTAHEVEGRSHRRHKSKLRWAKSYSVKVTKISLQSNIVEEITAWKTKYASRIDYNEGAVKLITVVPKKTKLDPIVVQIHPETTEEELNKIVCHYANITLPRRYYRPQEILPGLHGYKIVGNETYENGITVTRFEYNYSHRHTVMKQFLLASYDKKLGWIPRHFENTEYNSAAGSLTKHDILTFYDYRRIRSREKKVFNIKRLGCEEENSVIHDYNSEFVTKELVFIDPDNEDHVDHVFHHFKNKFDRRYAHEHETAMRRMIFQENMRLISSVNKQKRSYKLGVNQFSDWTAEEKQMTLGILPKKLQQSKLGNVDFPYDENTLAEELDKLPKEYDMRDLGLISPVKNQDMCGSCWTFAAAAVMEGALARVNGGRVLSLSTQAIVDCAYEGLTEEGGGGCQGGYDYAAYNFIEKHGLPTDMEYGPYKMRDGFCNIGNMSKTYKIQGYTSVTKYSPNAMKVAVVNNGPLYIYVHVSSNFFAYSGGIFYQPEKKCTPEDPNHAVILVGYGEQDGEPFWILKNSYGEYWGEDGYMRISARDNVCGVASNPTYPVL